MGGYRTGWAGVCVCVCVRGGGVPVGKECVYSVWARDWDRVGRSSSHTVAHLNRPNRDGKLNINIPAQCNCVN